MVDRIARTGQAASSGHQAPLAHQKVRVRGAKGKRGGAGGLGRSEDSFVSVGYFYFFIFDGGIAFIFSL